MEIDPIFICKLGPNRKKRWVLLRRVSSFWVFGDAGCAVQPFGTNYINDGYGRSFARRLNA
jgi:hypothetical protein